MFRVSPHPYISTSPAKRTLALLITTVLLAAGGPSACHQTQPDETPATEQTSATSALADDEQGSDEAPSADAALGEGRAADAKNRFSIPVPEGWSVTVLDDDWLQVISPDGDVDIFVGVAVQTDPEAAIAQAWTKGQAVLELEVKSISEPPASDGLESLMVITYEMGEGEQFAQAIGRQYQGDTYVFAISGTLAAIQKRAAQFNIIQSDMQIAALQKTDLSEVEALVFDAEKQAQFDAFIQQEFKRADIPGAAVAVVVGDEVVYKKGIGVRKLGADAPVTPSTLMMVGSVTKSMTTLMMAELVDAGKMRWDTPVSEVMPQFQLATQDATQRTQMQHLVCACTGVPRRDMEFLLNHAALNPQKMIESLKTFEFFTDFGESFQYSNQMVAAGGYAAAMANGATFDALESGYAEAMDAHIFNPLGMSRTTLSVDAATADGDYASPHSSGLNGEIYPLDLNYERFVDPLAPAGAAWSSVEEMAQFLSVQIREGIAPDGVRLVSAENLAETHRPRIALGAKTSYGLGWFIGEYKGAPVIHHGGNTMGFTAHVAYLPQAQIGIVVLTNAGGANWFPSTLKTRLWELIYAQSDGLAEKSAATYLKERDARRAERRTTLEAVPRDAVATYLGTYTNADIGEVTLAYIDGKLTADYGEGRVTLMRRTEKPEFFEGVDGILTGPFQLTQKDGVPHLILGQGTVRYTLTPKQ